MFKHKIKGILLVILGIAGIIFVYNFDVLAGRTTLFGSKTILSFCFATVMIVNGIRIYLRKR